MRSWIASVPGVVVTCHRHRRRRRRLLLLQRENCKGESQCPRHRCMVALYQLPLRLRACVFHSPSQTGPRVALQLWSCVTSRSFARHLSAFMAHVLLIHTCFAHSLAVITKNAWRLQRTARVSCTVPAVPHCHFTIIIVVVIIIISSSSSSSSISSSSIVIAINIALVAINSLSLGLQQRARYAAQNRVVPERN